MTSKKTRSVLVSAGTVETRDGVNHKQGTKLTLDDVEARDLLRLGVVREVGSEPAKSTAKEG